MTLAALTDDAVAERGLVERYVAGKLTDPQELIEFEAHLLTCARCRDEVTLAMAVRREIGASQTVTRKKLGLGIGLAAAAGIAALLLLPASHGAIKKLGLVAAPPVYDGVPVRATPVVGDSVFGAAMDAYTRGEYDEATRRLRQVLTMGADSTPALFFLGAGEMELGHLGASQDAYQHAIALGDSPYQAEARFYLAKIRLRLGDGPGAISELTRIPPDAGIARHAAALVDSVQRATRR